MRTVQICRLPGVYVKSPGNSTLTLPPGGLGVPAWHLVHKLSPGAPVLPAGGLLEKA